MSKRRYSRKQAIKRRNIFITCCVAVMAITTASIAFLLVEVFKKDTDKVTPNDKSSSSVSKDNKKDDNTSIPNANAQNQNDSSSASSSGQQFVEYGEYTLDANYSDLLLVNADNPLPADYDYESRLVTIDKKYLNGWRNQMRSDVYPYVKAMCEAAWNDGVDLYVLSPYRSYASQETLYNQQIQRQIDLGVDPEKAPEVAATVVARPGTSEHHTGIAIDFNTASQSFEGTKECLWLMEHAQDYGFILRYPKDKTDITGVIYEAWHYRFVGINEAKKIKNSGLCLEEYLEKYY